MLKKYRNASYAIIIGLVTVLISPVIGCAQNEGNALTYEDDVGTGANPIDGGVSVAADPVDGGVSVAADPVDGGVSATEDYVEETSVNEVQTEKLNYSLKFRAREIFPIRMCN